MTSVTRMIRMDHTHVMAVFHKYEPSLSARVKKGLVDQVCLAVEVHATLEEEIFYPALREVSDNEVLRKSEPEHYEMKQLIARLRAMEGTGPELDSTFYTLMQNIIHHVADEETVLLPLAERVLVKELDDLGSRWSRRKMHLMAPRAPEMASGMARSMSGSGLLIAAGAVLLGGLLVAKRNAMEQAVTHAHRMMKRRKLMAQVQNLLPGHKTVASRVLARLP
ncbi:hemerythrin domain-containing protein [Ramlibacter albus]|uniref:Hemerythrin domain-containing protein n=1 Tax=Ramlibacter albus TaxID=2079448 RepID=A0A923S274_9BURK|nr:hemerythrin domain-containing protein [Ramlibacter albus]MBC5765184.1 hemerythrin domain-containing protein [Ramlibacter albus]